jgi:hypothetical protein
MNLSSVYRVMLTMFPKVTIVEEPNGVITFKTNMVLGEDKSTLIPLSEVDDTDDIE